MSEPLRGLTARTAGRVAQLLADGGAVGGAARTATPARGVTWVKVTGGPDGDGWHPAVVSLPDGGGWDDGAAAVLVAGAGGAGLLAGDRYLCSRTGDAADGTPRFRATGAAARPLAAVMAGAGAATGRTLDPAGAWGDSGATYADAVYPAEVDAAGTTFAAAPGAPVLLWEEAPGTGRYAALPIQSADYDAGTSTFFGGYVSTGAQTWTGTKLLVGDFTATGTGTFGTYTGTETTGGIQAANAYLSGPYGSYFTANAYEPSPGYYQTQFMIRSRTAFGLVSMESAGSKVKLSSASGNVTFFANGTGWFRVDGICNGDTLLGQDVLTSTLSVTHPGGGILPVKTHSFNGIDYSAGQNLYKTVGSDVRQVFRNGLYVGDTPAILFAGDVSAADLSGTLDGGSF